MSYHWCPKCRNEAWPEFDDAERCTKCHERIVAIGKETLPAPLYEMVSHGHCGETMEPAEDGDWVSADNYLATLAEAVALARRVADDLAYTGGPLLKQARTFLEAHGQ